MLNLFNKLKITFLFSLTLLFSLSFADIEINGVNYFASDLDYDYSIDFYTDNYFLVKSTEVGSNYVYLPYFFETSTFSNISKLGIFKESDDTYELIALDSSNNMVDTNFKYMAFSASTGVVVLQDSRGTHYLSQYDFPYTLDSTNYWDYGNIFAYDSLNYEFRYSPFDVYEITSFNPYPTAILGNKIYTADSSPVSPPSHEPFSPSISSQTINDNTILGLSKKFVQDNVPKNYDNLFVTYIEDKDEYRFFFYPTTCSPKGYIWDNVPDYTYYTVDFDRPNSKEFYIYSFLMWSDGFVVGKNITSYTDFKKWDFDYENEPVIYTNKDFPFYTVYDGLHSSNPDFTLTPSTLVDSGGQTVTVSDSLDTPMSLDKIWSMIYNIFNPDSNSTAEMSEIENQHEQIINKSDYDSFSNLFDSSKSLIGDLTQITWLIVACETLFNYFSSFLILCCVFITINRIIGR